MNWNFLKEQIVNSFLGKESLSIAFWQNFFLGQFVLAISAFGIAAILYLLIGENAGYLKVLTYPLWYLFLMWAMISIWRCANNTKHRIWLYTSRLFVVLYSSGVVLGVIQNA